jgi:beta-lactamase regulating signal transducer with metallopeptidase domain
MLLSYWPRLFCLVLFGLGTIQVVLCLLSRVAMPFLDRVVSQMTARWQERLRFAIPATPHVVALVLALVVIAPQYIRNEANPLQERVGIACVIGALVVAARYLYGMLSAARRLLQERQAHTFDGVPAVLTGGVKVHISEGAHPLLAVTGIFSPRIVISRHLLDNAAFSAELLQIALAHENAHVSHRDNLKHLVLASLALSPSEKERSLRQWRYAAEIAADDEAVAGNSLRAILLAETLLVAARTIPHQGVSTLSLGLRPHEEELDKRIDRLLRDDAIPAPGMAHAWRHIMGVTVLVFAGICGLLQLFAASIHRMSEFVLHLG